MSPSRHPVPAASLPDTYPRRVLLAVTGLSPQVITETLYALAVLGRPRWVPNEIHVLTTREGADRVRLTLLSRSPGWLGRLRREYRLPPLPLPPRNIRVLTGAGGELADIRTPADSERLADTVTALVRALTAEPTTALHVSIAGGRKTMGFYAGYALSLYGRPQDRLSHVLVSPPFESNPEFFYPPPRARIIYTPGPASRPLDASRASVWLAEIPFVRLRGGLPAGLAAGAARGQAASFSATVAALNRAWAPPRLVLDAAGLVFCGGQAVPLPPADWALLAWFARRAAAGAPPLERAGLSSALAGEFLSEYARACRGDGSRLAAARGLLRGGMEAADFDMRRSRLHRRLRRVLGPAAAHYCIAAHGVRPDTSYALDLNPRQIEFAPPTRGPA